MKKIFHFGEDHLTLSAALAISRGEVSAVIGEGARERIRRSSAVVEKIAAAPEASYGINTGFGSLCRTRISPGDTKKLQSNILVSHAVGVGNFIEPDLVKLMLILKLHALSLGYSGIQQTTLDRMIWFLESDIMPLVPEKGSVGASGDLAPLSHLFLPLIGLGEVYYKGKNMDAAVLLKEKAMAPLNLSAKEGLALINGTQFIAAHAVAAVARLKNVLDSASIIGALMVEGLRASSQPFLPELHALRPFAANRHVAATILNLLKDSSITASHLHCDKVQDPYSLRCIPQVHGAAFTAWLHLKELVETEINSVTDNPVIINEELVISGGNFHAQPLAMALDYCCIAASEIGNISDRRIYLSLDHYDENVPGLLMRDTGINSGFMIVQYTTAALASENKGLCFPSSADSIPTSLGQEDHVSMGSISGRKLLQVIANTEQILGIELLCACQALDFQLPLRPAKILGDIYDAVREVIPHLEQDEPIKKHMDTAVRFVKQQALTKMAKELAHEGMIYHTDWTAVFDRY